ncbi:SipW-dependent-type signal peptide-containing protein [Nocardioides sp. P5_C9_2]
MRPRDTSGFRVLGSVRVRAALALGVLVAPLGVNTMAYWSSRVVISPGTVRAGSFDLKVNGGDQQVALGLDVVDMARNTSTAAVVTLSNTSTGDNAVMTYTVDAVTADTAPTGTGAALTARVTTASAVTTSSAGKTCEGIVVPSSTSFAGTLVGTPQSLPAGQSRTLCVQADLGPNAPAGGRTSITLTFKAVQKDPNA